jgi:DNA mismatch endonuclease, patch repair protein
MPQKRKKNIVSYNMSRIRSKGTKLEEELEKILISISNNYNNHPKIFGNPDFAYLKLKIAIFADSDFWHGYKWEEKQKELQTNRDFWIKKIEGNMLRDSQVTKKLQEEGWKVIRLWGHEILKNPDQCREKILFSLSSRQSVKGD